MKICLSCEGISATEQENCGSCGIALLPTEAVHYPLRRGEVDAANPLLGTMLDGKYRVASVLGRGGMGTVYRAVHAVSLVPVALKLLHPRYGSRPDYRRAFLAEARKAGRVVHDHCARVLDVGETEDGTAYLAMELAEGDTLEEWTRGGRGLAPEAVLEILEQVCRALVAIHGAGLVHRDLSARNVMVSVREGAPVVKVLDFGIAKAAALVARNGQVEAGAEPPGFANPVFSAPEHLAGKPVDARADLYSLGVIGYLLLAGTLPVAAHEPGEAARATVEGRLRPLPRQTGVGRRLGHLIGRCLQRDPELRPASAGEVLRELARIRMAPQQRARLGWFALAAAVAAMLSTFLFAGKVYLRPVVGSPFEGYWQNRAQVLHAQSKALASLHFDCGGFAMDRLQVEVSRDGASLANPYYLDAVADRSRGQLMLSRAQSGWSDALAGIARASAEGSPVDLQFRVPGQPPLGGVRLLVDDVAPVLDCKWLNVREDGGVWLLGGTRLQYHITEAGGIQSAGVKVRFQDGREIDLDLPISDNQLDLGRELARRLSGVKDHGPGRIAPWAMDLAGNRCEPEARSFDHCDVAAPLVEAVNGVAAGTVVVNYTGPEANLRLRLSDSESDLVITAISPDERPQELRELRDDGQQWLLATLRAREDLQPFLSGQYKFEVVDHAGNQSRTRWQLMFQNRRLDAALQPVPEEKGKALQVGNELVLAPGERKLEFRCNEAFAIESLQLSSNADPTPVPVFSKLAAPGRTLLTLPALAPGLYTLAMRVAADGAAAPAGPYQLRVLPERNELRLPEVRERFLPALINGGVLQRKEQDVCDGRGWNVDATLRPVLRGNLWRDGVVLTSITLPEASGEAPLLPYVRLVNGHNVLALELHDVLNRPVSVLVGDRPAPVLRQGDVDLAVVADFVFQSEPPALVGEEVLVEHDQPARIQVRSPLPFTEQECAAIRLRFGQSEYPPLSSGREDMPEGGVVLTFRVPASTWVVVAELSGVERERYGSSITGKVDVSLMTPAGTDKLRLNLRTTRSLLVPLRLGALAKPSRLPAPLQDMLLVPVLAPEGALPDPVLADLPGRGLFRHRREREVKNWSDYYLQDRELTLGQYAALCHAFFALPAEERPEWRRIVHCDDPLGAGRLRSEAMVPLAWAERPAEFFRLAGAMPDQAVAGVDWFQAHAATHMLGVLCNGNPDLFRLPLGCELEFAALGDAPKGAMNGPSARKSGVSVERFMAAGERWQQTGTTCSAADCEKAGDQVPTNFRGRDPGDVVPFLGLDFGVREWVIDLPEGGDMLESVLGEWVGDHAAHLQHCREFAAGRAPPADSAALLRTMAVVRGLALGEAPGLISARTGGPAFLPPSGVLPEDVPGAVRTEQMRRDGRGLTPGSLDPRLLRTGFRIAGGTAFAQQVRGR